MWPRALLTSLLIVFLSLVLLACGDDEEKSGALGSEYSPDNADCDEDFICADDGDGTNRCVHPTGSACDVEADSPWCQGGSECVELPLLEDGSTPDPAAQCLIPEGGECNPEQAEFCGLGLNCAELQSGGHACYPPVVFAGRVFDSATLAPIEGAHVIALDDISVAVTDIAVSDVDGNYWLEIPAVRDETGAP